MSATEYKMRRYSPWDWKEFDTVRLEISVGQQYHEGTKLETACRWARDNFKRAVLIVGDSIQAYNMARATGIDLQSCFKSATAAGDEWLERNAAAIKGMEVTRWNDWLSHPAYEKNHASIVKLYQENTEFRNHVERAIAEFMERKPPGDVERFTSLSRDFLLEETSVFATAYAELGGISAYPGSFLGFWEMFVDRDVAGAPAGLKNAHWMRLQFRRREPSINAA